MEIFKKYLVGKSIDYMDRLFRGLRERVIENGLSFFLFLACVNRWIMRSLIVRDVKK